MELLAISATTTTDHSNDAESVPTPSSPSRPVQQEHPQQPIGRRSLLRTASDTEGRSERNSSPASDVAQHSMAGTATAISFSATEDERALTGHLLANSTLPIPPPRRRGFVTAIRDLLGLKTVDTAWREIPIGVQPGQFKASSYPPNEINNCRYSLVTFLPKALLSQFKMFFNVYFLVVAMSQLVPMFQVGFLFIYFAPLAFVVSLSLLKEAVDDLKRWRRDAAVNAEQFEVLGPNGEAKVVAARDIKVGTLLRIHAKQRIPADCVLLHTSEKSGASFVRTDQLDGETDWKLRYPVKGTQHVSPTELATFRMNIHCEPLHDDIYKFQGQVRIGGRDPEGINLENTLWCTCVLASGTVVATVIHTGNDTRSAMNAAKATSKSGLLDAELNRISACCFALLVLLSILLVAQQGFQGLWIVNFVRFQILLSAIIPISMRVNLEVARVWYSLVIYRDPKIAGTVVRNTNIPEDLGRLSYLFSDKTGTLTRNVMEFRTLQLGAHLTLGDKDRDDFQQPLEVYFAAGRDREKASHGRAKKISAFTLPQIKEIGNAVLALSLCHNVTPVKTETGEVEFQASSPDEVAMVKFTDSIGVTLHDRTLRTITLRVPGPNGQSQQLQYTIVKIFPFSSDRKCMGIILQDDQTKQHVFWMKGADVKMLSVIRRCDWLEEGTQEMSKKGLRTLVFAQRPLTNDEVQKFFSDYSAANAILGDGRATAVEESMRLLETGMNLVCVTGVEDHLQENVTESLETLGMCGVRVWMLTGDKVETAACIGRSTQLIPRNATIEYLLARSASEAKVRLTELADRYHIVVAAKGDSSSDGGRGSMHDDSASNFNSNNGRGSRSGSRLGGGGSVVPRASGNNAINDFGMMAKWTLVMDGTCLALCLTPEIEQLFVNVARTASSVIVARCSPTQKADVVKTVLKYSPSNIRAAAIGDGGNDVSMILAAHVGIGVEGVEGKQASMAADFSITKFSNCLRLITWHGRNSYKRSCQLSQFIMHRGIVYSVVQTVFSMLFGGSTMSVFNGYLLMGYATFFTVAPVFALVLNEDYSEDAISEFPQLYSELIKSRSLNIRSFLQWVWVSFFQGGVMMYLSIMLFSDELFQIVSIAFTSLLVTELVVVASVMHFRLLWRQRRLHFFLFLASELFSIFMFFLAVLFLPDTFDKRFFFSWAFVSKVLLICLASIGPIFLLWLVARVCLFRRQVSRVVY